jgi:hypothetical protein
MLVGAMIAASDDLTFNWFGYIFLLINNICTAAQGIIIKQKLVNKVNRKVFRFICLLMLFFMKRKIYKTVGSS